MKRYIIISLVFLLSTGAWSAGTKVDNRTVKVYPESTLTLELDINRSNMLPLLLASMPVIASEMGDKVKDIDLVALARALKDVERIEYLQMEISAQKADKTGIISFYQKNLPNGKWERMFWQSYFDDKTIAVYDRVEGEGIYGFRTELVARNTKKINRIDVVHIDGKVDWTKLVEIIARVL